MEVEHILAQVAEAGISLSLVDGRIRYQPAGRMTPDLAVVITEHRAAIVAWLEERDSAQKHKNTKTLARTYRDITDADRDTLSLVRRWYDAGLLDGLEPFDLGPGEHVFDPPTFVRTTLADAAVGGVFGAGARHRLERFAAIVAPLVEGRVSR